VFSAECFLYRRRVFFSLPPELSCDLLNNRVSVALFAFRTPLDSWKILLPDSFFLAFGGRALPKRGCGPIAAINQSVAMLLPP